MTAERIGARRWWIALAGSFAVYLIPLVGSHAFWLLGGFFITPSGGRNAQWLAANVLLPLSAQVIVTLRLVWSLRGSRFRLLVWVPTIPMLVAAAAIDPSGRLIAVSESTTLSIGDARDVVYVIRVEDGSEVFRAYVSVTRAVPWCFSTRILRVFGR